MRHTMRNAAGSITIFAVAFSATAGVALACPMNAYNCRPIEWRTNAWTGGGYDLNVAFGHGVVNSEVVNAVLGRYPYRTYGYNNGLCIAYRLICDEAGHVIGEEPVVTC
jgi:hypothetical protein